MSPYESKTMPDAKHKYAGLLTYLLVTFGLAWAIELGPVRALGYQTGNSILMLWMIGVMFTPTLGSLAAHWVERRDFSDACLRWGRGRYQLVAWLLPFGFAVVAFGLTLLLGLGTLDPHATVILEKVPAAQHAAVAAQFAKFGGWLPAIIIFSGLTQGVLFTSIATFGEEFGWRGYLQPRLASLGNLGSMLVTGMIWGVWHAPIIMQGHNYPGRPYSGVLLMVVFCTLLAVVFGWLFQRSASVIAPTLAHASLNSPAASLAVFARGTDPALGGITGLVGLAVMAIFVIWLVLSGRVVSSEQPR